MAFATNFTRAFSTSLAQNAIKKIIVIGGGQMGSGIAQVAAQSGHEVTLVDVSEDLLKKSHASVSKSLSRVVKKKYADDKEGGEKFMSETLARISTNTDAVVAVKDSDLVVEAIIENIDIKQKLFSSLDKAAPGHTIFASNTSSLSIKEIANSTKRPDRFGGLHFFNPVPVMKLVEVVRTQETSAETNSALIEFSKKIGKTPVQAKDVPGFIVNRLLVPYLMESVKMVERGDATFDDVDVAMQLGCGYPMGPIKLSDYIGLDTLQSVYMGDASAKDIDTAMKLGTGVPMGPLELADYVGLDTSKFIIDGWSQIFKNNPMFEPSDLLNKMVEDGKLGVKSGEGFYNYKK